MGDDKEGSKKLNKWGNFKRISFCPSCGWWIIKYSYRYRIGVVKTTPYVCPKCGDDNWEDWAARVHYKINVCRVRRGWFGRESWDVKKEAIGVEIKVGTNRRYIPAECVDFKADDMSIALETVEQ